MQLCLCLPLFVVLGPFWAVFNFAHLEIDKTTTPHIRPNEFNALRGKEHVIQEKLKKYIADYKKAKECPDLERNRMILRYSTLQYFEKYL